MRERETRTGRLRISTANAVGRVVCYVSERRLTMLKFLGVSGSAVMLNLFLLFLLVTYLGFGTRLGENAANAISMELSIIYNFFMSRAITWRDRPRESGNGLFLQTLRFHLVIGITLVFRLALFPLLQLFDVHYLVNAAIGIGLAATFNFVIYDTLVFRRGE